MFRTLTCLSHLHQNVFVTLSVSVCVLVVLLLPADISWLINGAYADTPDAYADLIVSRRRQTDGCDDE